MSRTARLFTLLDALRAHRSPVQAQRLADELAVSVRTIYRDMQTLIGLGAPIEGEAGVGYVLSTGFFLPPLMFDADEVEALVLGARWVQSEGDVALAAAAARALAKIATASPKDLRDAMADTGLWIPPSGATLAWHARSPDPERAARAAEALEAVKRTKAALQCLREAIRNEHKIRIAYADESGRPSERVIWPIGLNFYEYTRVATAWCELREGFRHFRIDRIGELTLTGERYPKRRAALVKAWRQEMDICLDEA
jgi:predicted DNA-binding transcriptional regulator YafY